MLYNIIFKMYREKQDKMNKEVTTVQDKTESEKSK
jgi:hypothetical protein